jgi:hypothetical protein
LLIQRNVMAVVFVAGCVLPFHWKSIGSRTKKGTTEIYLTLCLYEIKR